MKMRNKIITIRHLGSALLAVAVFVSFPQQTFAADPMTGAPSPGMGAGAKPMRGGMGVMASHPTGAMNDDWEAPPRAARKANPVPSVEEALGIGKALYAAECVACHGKKGKGDGPGAISLERGGKRIKPGNLSDPMMWQHADGDLFWKISEGKSPMPAFAKRFSEEQRWQIVNYVRTLALKPPTQTGALRTPTAPSPAKPLAEAAKDYAVSERYVTQHADQKTPAETKATNFGKGGAQLWAENCVRCHNIRSPSSYSDAQWELVMLHMRVRADLTAEKQRKILEFLKSAN